MSLPTSLLFYLRWIAILAAGFACLYLIAGEDGAPGGPLFAFALISVVSGFAGAVLQSQLPTIPPLLGMLVSGVLMRNLPAPIGTEVGEKVDPNSSAAIRSLALTLILARAGLSLDVRAMWRLKFAVVRLAFLPNIAEASVIALLAVAWLDFPLAWGCMLGFVVAAISPAVVIPSLLSLQEKGYCAGTGIVPLVIASAALDDVCAIAGFGISMSFAIVSSSDGPEWLQYARAPVEISLGLVVGGVGGMLVASLVPTERREAESDDSKPNASKPGATVGKSESDTSASLWRAVLLVSFGAAAFFGLKKAKFSGAAALAVLALGAGANVRWGADAVPVAALLAQLWNRAVQPVLFGLVGAAVSLKTLDGRTIGFGVAMLAISTLVRCGTVAFIALGKCGSKGSGSDDAPRAWTWGERIFVALAWTPKATVQAAIGGIALDYASNSREQDMGRDILNISLMAILLAAPCGSILVTTMGPRLLGRASVEQALEQGLAEESDEIHGMPELCERSQSLI